MSWGGKDKICGNHIIYFLVSGSCKNSYHIILQNLKAVTLLSLGISTSFIHYGFMLCSTIGETPGICWSDIQLEILIWYPLNWTLPYSSAFY